MRKIRTQKYSAAIVVGVAVLLLMQAAAVEKQDVPFAYRGLVPGKATIDDVKKQFGQAALATEGKNDLRYASIDHPELNDRLYFRGRKLALVTSASPDPRYRSHADIVKRFGEPESRVRFQTQQYLDYTEQGLRFICDADDKTTGVLYFEPMRRRVPAGYPNANIDLRRNKPPAGTGKKLTGFRVGVSQISIAPERFDNITADAKSNPRNIGEDLFARVAVFEKGKTRLVVVGLDVFGMGAWDLKRLRDRLREKGIDKVVIAMSHTHANVDTIGFYGYYPRDYAEHILKQTEKAIHQAANNMQTVRSLKMGSVEMPLAGGRVVDLIRNGRDPGVMDPTVSILQAIGNDGRPMMNLIHLACHPEVISLSSTRGLSPDFVGALCREVNRRLGGQSVFLNGALGGMITPDTRFRSQKTAEKMGLALAEFVIDAAKQAKPSSSDALWLYRRPVEYPMTGESVVKFLKNPPWPVDFHQGRVRTEMNVVWIGDAQFITVPGELLPDIGFEIVSQMRGRLRLVVGLANDQFGYLIPSFDFRAGHYEERTGPGAAGGEITRSVGLELAPMMPPEAGAPPPQ